MFVTTSNMEIVRNDARLNIGTISQFIDVCIIMKISLSPKEGHSLRVRCFQYQSNKHNGMNTQIPRDGCHCSSGIIWVNLVVSSVLDLHQTFVRWPHGFITIQLFVKLQRSFESRSVFWHYQWTNDRKIKLTLYFCRKVNEGTISLQYCIVFDSLLPEVLLVLSETVI